MYYTDKDCYKDGIKMLIPSIQITRSFKKYIIDTIIEEKTLDEVFKEIIPHSSTTRSNFLKKNSDHAYVFFLGSVSNITKSGIPPYDLVKVYHTTLGQSKIVLKPIQLNAM